MNDVIAVMDLRGGRCVAAVGGDRDQYRPVARFDRHTIDGDPIALAKCFAARGLSRVYVADLDAIQSGQLQRATLMRLASLWSTTTTLSELWLDIGNPAAFAGVETIFDGLSVRWIHATETLQTVDTFRDSIAQVRGRWPRDSNAVSMDYRGSRFLGSDEPSWWDEIGVSRWPTIVLDLAKVGSDTGVDPQSVAKRERVLGTDVTMVTGGGVRDSRDVAALIDAGWHAVLVGTALQRLVPVLEPFDRNG